MKPYEIGVMLIIISVVSLALSIVSGTLWVCSKCEVNVSARQRSAGCLTSNLGRAIANGLKKQKESCIHQPPFSVLCIERSAQHLEEDKQLGNFKYTYRECAVLIALALVGSVGEGWKKP